MGTNCLNIHKASYCNQSNYRQYKTRESPIYEFDCKCRGTDKLHMFGAWIQVSKDHNKRMGIVNFMNPFEVSDQGD